MTSEETCIAALEHAAERLGHSPTREEYDELGLTPSSTTIVNALGWSEAKRCAGLETMPGGPTYSDEEIIAAVADVADRDESGGRLGRARYEQLRDDGQPSHQTVVQRVGSWEAARKLATE